MSFLKKLFDKLTPDDDKYGKGHRLGDAREEERKRREREANAAAVADARPKTSSLLRPNSNEAAQAAGQAALSRLQQKQNPKPAGYVVVDEKRQLEEEKRRIEEAEKLKQHYFGSSHKTQIEASTHLTNQKIQISFKCPDLFGDGLSLPKSKLEEHIEDKLMENISDEPLLTALTLLFTLNYKNDDKLDKCLETLNKIVDNIMTYPNEDKYRKIRCENAQLKEKVLSCKYSELLLTVIGFKLIHQPKQASDDTTTDTHEAFYIFQHEDENNFNKLKELKESLKIVKPIKPVLDRNSQLFQIKNSSTQNDANTFNLCDEFYNLNINEIKREQKQREEALEKLGALRTKAMRERDEINEQRKYNYCLIRVKFSDSIYLQMIFKSIETLQDLYLCVQSCLKDETITFELSSFLLKSQQQQQQQNFNQTFAELGLAPAAVLHFRSSVPIGINLDLFKENLLFNVRNSFL